MARSLQALPSRHSGQILAGVILALGLLGLTTARAAPEVKLSPAQMQSLGVRVAHPVSSPTDQTLPYPAQIVIPTPQLWVVSAPVAGMVTSLSVARGDRVNAGQPLVTLESPSFVSLQRDYLHAVAQDVLAAQQLKRNTELVRGQGGAATRSGDQPDRSPAGKHCRGGTTADASAQRPLRRGDLTADQRGRDHGDTFGRQRLQPATVVDIVVSPGQRVEQSAPLVKLARLSPLWVEIAIPASSIRAIRPGAKVEVDGYATPGQVVLVSETTDAATQTMLVRAEVPNTGELRPGQTAAVRISFLSLPVKAPGRSRTARLSGAARPGVGLRCDRGRLSSGAGDAARRGSGPRRGLGRDHGQGRGGRQRHLRAARHLAAARSRRVMLERLVAFALSQRLFVALSVLLLIGAGVVVLPSLPIDAFPDVSPVQVKVIMKAPGLTPEEVEQRITVPIELELLGLPNKKILRSTTKYALADITVDFEDGTDIYWARNQVSERLSNIARDLPEGVTGGLAPITSPLGEMFMFTIDSPDLSLAERRSLLDWVIRPALRTVPGVADVNALGGHVRAFEIVPLSDALAARGISSDLFRRAIETNSRNDGAGRVNQGEDSALVRIEGSIRTIDDISAIVVDTRDGIPIRVNDVARVQVGSLTRYGAVTIDGHGETVEGLVLGLRGANAGQLVRDVRQRLEELQPSLPKSVTINVFYDRSRLVGRAVGTVVRALGEATVLVIVLLLLFLGNWRASLVIALSLPLAIVIALIVMRAVGMSANLMSLGGLAIAIGMLIDALVVVVENIVGNLSKEPAGKTTPLVHIVFRSVCEVLEPVASGVLIIIIVFVPLLTLQGLEGKLFIPVALAIIFALAASLLLALTVIPVATSFLLKARPAPRAVADPACLARLCACAWLGTDQ